VYFIPRNPSDAPRTCATSWIQGSSTFAASRPCCADSEDAALLETGEDLVGPRVLGRNNPDLANVLRLLARNVESEAHQMHQVGASSAPALPRELTEGVMAARVTWTDREVVDLISAVVWMDRRHVAAMQSKGLWLGTDVSDDWLSAGSEYEFGVARSAFAYPRRGHTEPVNRNETVSSRV
jgi:hypothetical protein